MRDGFTEGARVAAIGATGFIASLSLTDVSVIVSILVGLATLVYIVAKTYFLFRNNGRDTRGG